MVEQEKVTKSVTYMAMSDFRSARQEGGKGPPISEIRGAIEAMVPGEVLVFRHDKPCLDSQRCPMSARMHRIKNSEARRNGGRAWSTKHIAGDWAVACYTREGS